MLSILSLVDDCSWARLLLINWGLCPNPRQKENNFLCSLKRSVTGCYIFWYEKLILFKKGTFGNCCGWGHFVIART